MIYGYFGSLLFLFLYFGADEPLSWSGAGTALIKAARLQLLIFGIYYLVEYIL